MGRYIHNETVSVPPNLDFAAIFMVTVHVFFNTSSSTNVVHLDGLASNAITVGSAMFSNYVVDCFVASFTDTALSDLLVATTQQRLILGMLQR